MLKANTTAHSSMPKSKKIGSIKNGKINYPPDQNFFHSSDIPPKVSSTLDNYM